MENMSVSETADEDKPKKEEPKWYVVHTYSGYENKVKANIEKIIENRGMQDQIHEVCVPMQEVVEIKNGQKKVVQRKVFPGYVLLKMFINKEAYVDSWYVVRNTRGVTSFVGPGSEPVPLTDAEVRAMGIESYTQKFDFEVGDHIKVINGPFLDFEGVIREINPSKKTVIVRLSMLGRETPAEFDYKQIEKVL
ncbi:MAG: transcription termination/antitermination factor NusG [Firmicutes bacterium]|nr:transcription termination/antitermination factor NusG [Bacillota bacterium]